MAVLWSALKDMFEEAIGDTSEAYFDDDAQERLVNNVLNKMAEASEYYDYSVTGTTTASQAYENISPLFDVFRVEVDDEPMTLTTVRELRRNDRDWEERTGHPRYWHADEISSLAVRRVGLWPVPNSTWSYTIIGHSKPTQCDNDHLDYYVHVPCWAEYGVLFGMLAQAFAADTQIKNEETAYVFKVLFDDVLFRLRARSFSKLNKSWARRRGGTGFRMTIWDTIEDPDGS